MLRYLVRSSMLLLTAVLVIACGSRRLSTAADAGFDVSSGADVLVMKDLARADRGTCEPQWSCTGDEAGDTCRAQHFSLPHVQILGAWRCHWTDGNVYAPPSWHCDGRRHRGDQPYPPLPPCLRGWSCKVVMALESSSPDLLRHPYDELLRCSRPVAAQDEPPTSKPVACVLGSAFSGLRCTILASPPTLPGPFPKPHEPCTPGEKIWCSDEQFDGWGQVSCGADGRWKTAMANGKIVWDCHELGDGRRPDTLCACYHPFFTPSCCERPDCKVAIRDDGTESSQVCPKSRGKRCDYCDHQTPCAGPKSRCLHTIYGESFCAERCGPMDRCPYGHTCESIKGANGQEERYCVLNDHSCYYDYGQSP